MSRVKTNGFTLVELMLAMSFISLLLLAIAMTTIQVSNIYTKGITLREVNQAGRAVSDELQRSIASSAPFEVDTTLPNTKYISQTGGGRLCTGRYTYAWNFGSALKGGTGAPLIMNKYTAGDTTQIRFVKVSDSASDLCPSSGPLPAIDRSKATEMLTGGDRDLAMHKFTITKGAEDLTLGQTIYAISMVIGTNDRAELVTGDTSCKPPAQGQGNENYCSVNQFDIIARAGNKSGAN
jgi:type II secretory pathway pseudopilin PulG